MSANSVSKSMSWLIVLIMLVTMDLVFFQGSRHWPTIQSGPQRLGLILLTIWIANVVIATGCALLIAGPWSISRKVAFTSSVWDSERESVIRDQAASLNPSRLDLRVLVVEEDPMMGRMILRLLERIGCSAEVVSDGLEAIRSREAGKSDVILMNVGSPGLDGWSITLEIRRIESEQGLARIPILAMTSDLTNSEGLPIQDVGIDGLVTEPLSFDHLFVALSRWARPTAKRLMAETSVFDFESLLVRCSGDRRLVAELIETFFAVSTGSMENLRRAIEVDDSLRLKVEARGLAGSARTIGATVLAGHCLSLETTARLNNFGAARAIFSTVKLEWETLRLILELRLRETS